jgi:hypothetical protein
MFKDISNFVKKCKQCQYTNKKTETTVDDVGAHRNQDLVNNIFVLLKGRDMVY